MSKKQQAKTRISPKTGNKQELINGRWRNVEINPKKSSSDKSSTSKEQIKSDFSKTSSQGKPHDNRIDSCVSVSERKIEQIENGEFFYAEDICEITPGLKEYVNPDAARRNDPGDYHSHDQKYVEYPRLMINQPYRFHANIFPEMKPIQVVDLEMRGMLLTGKDFFAGVYEDYYGDDFDGMHLTENGKEKVAGITAYLTYVNSKKESGDIDDDDLDDFIEDVKSEVDTEEKRRYRYYKRYDDY